MKSKCFGRFAKCDNFPPGGAGKSESCSRRLRDVLASGGKFENLVRKPRRNAIFRITTRDCVSRPGKGSPGKFGKLISRSGNGRETGNGT